MNASFSADSSSANCELQDCQNEHDGTDYVHHVLKMQIGERHSVVLKFGTILRQNDIMGGLATLLDGRYLITCTSQTSYDGRSSRVRPGQ
jgi:hypothetical protein